MYSTCSEEREERNRKEKRRGEEWKGVDGRRSKGKEEGGEGERRGEKENGGVQRGEQGKAGWLDRNAVMLNIPSQAGLFISPLSQLLAGREAICQSVQPISPK